MECKNCGFFSNEIDKKTGLCKECNPYNSAIDSGTKLQNNSFNSGAGVQAGEARPIAFKHSFGVAVSILMIAGGALLVSAVTLMFLFVLGGAIGGGIAGGGGAMGVYMIVLPISVAKLPNERLFIDENNLYSHNKKITMSLASIHNVGAKNKAVVITHSAQAKPFVVQHVKNANEAVQEISKAIENFRIRTGHSSGVY